MLTFANFGYVLADVASDGFMVWMAHHESEERRGKIQNLVYIMREVGGIIISIVISKCRVVLLLQLQAFFWTDLLTAAAYFIFPHAQSLPFQDPKQIVMATNQIQTCLVLLTSLLLVVTVCMSRTLRIQNGAIKFATVQPFRLD